MTTRWRIDVRDDAGRAKILLLDGGNPVGMASVSWASYRQLISALVGMVTVDARAIVAKYLAERIWQDAQRASDNSTELAMTRLAQLGWTQATVDAYADEITRQLLDQLLARLPEHR